MEFTKDYYNLVYKNEIGDKIKLRRRKDIRGFQREDGTLLSHTWVYSNYDFVCMVDRSGKASLMRVDELFSVVGET